MLVAKRRRSQAEGGSLTKRTGGVCGECLLGDGTEDDDVALSREDAMEEVGTSTSSIAERLSRAYWYFSIAARWGDGEANFYLARSFYGKGESAIGLEKNLTRALELLDEVERLDPLAWFPVWVERYCLRARRWLHK